MKNSLKRVLSIALVMMLILSCVPTMAFAAEDSHAAQNLTTGAAYATLAEAMAAATAGQTVKVLANSDETVTYTDGVILDLNGYNLTNVTVPAGVTLTAIDSATDDYAGSFGSLSGDIAGTVASTVKTAEPKSYVSINENGSWSFHRYYAAITAISLKPGSAALGYKAEYYGDEAVKNAVVNYGYEMWLNDYAHKTLSMTNKLEKNTLTLRLNNILKEGNDGLNAIGSTASINGKAFITLNVNGENVTLYSAEKTTTLRSTIEAINANVVAYSETALQAVRNLCTTFAPWMMGWATENIFGVSEGEGDLNVDITVPVTAENNVLSEDAVLSCGNIIATVPAGTQLADGTTKLKLTIVDKASSDSDVETTEDETLRPMDVHIEGISADNNTPIIICLGNVLPKGLNIGNYDLYHVEDGETVPMTRAYTLSELDAHNEFHYDPATGAVTIAVVSFSEFTLKSTAAQWTGKADHTWYNTTDTTLYIYNADQLWSFSQIVGGMDGQTRDNFAGKTVVLYADIDLNDKEEDGKIFYPIGYYNDEEIYDKNQDKAISSWLKSFEGTFDGNGHTISNFYQNTWEMKGDHNWYGATEQHYRDGMGLFGKVYGGTVKNLTVKNFSSDGEIATTGTIAAYADNGATFENITIFNCNPRVYNIGNGGIVGCVGWYNNEVTDENPVTFKNITVDNTNKISALWGSYDVACGGLVGQYYPISGQDNATNNAGIYMENCHVAAQIDVYNDVCGNYMYYAYRYAGMLIGSVRENIAGDGSKLYPDTGRVYPNIDGITANDCTVHYGEWNHYYYCEFESNGHPSYAQADEYKFSRIPESELVRDSDGKVTGCTHTHTDAEDNRAIYLPFYDQLVTGYGWGVTSMGITDIDGVEILDRLVADSVVKFDKDVADGTTYWTDSEVTVGDLFSVKSDIPAVLTVDSKNVQISVSPVGTTSTAGGIYTANTSDWTQGTLSFSGKGAAEIIITDYYFCIETRLEVYVDGYTVRYNDPNGITTVIYGKDGITELPARKAYDGKEFYGWATSPVDDKATTADVITVGYKPANKDNFFLYAVYTYTEETASATETAYELTDLANIKSTDIVVITMTNASGTYALSSANGTSSAAPAVKVTVNGTKLSGTIAEAIKWNIYNNSGSLTICTKGSTKNNMYLSTTSSNNNIRVGTNTSRNTWVLNANGYLQNQTEQTRFLGVYNSQDWRAYTSVTGSSNIANQTLGFYVEKTVTTGSVENTYYVSFLTICDHSNTFTDTQAATCTENGCTTVICSDCGATISTVEIPAIGHNYVDGVCSVCDAVKATNATITFDNTNKRTELSAAKQVWEENGITVTNTSATNNIADYSNPVRFYKNTIVVIEFPEMTKIEVVCSSESYATALQGSIEGSVKNGTTVIISFAATNSYTMTMSVDQVRVNSITVYTEDGTSSVCDHIGAETTTTTIPASCTENGATIETCNNCGTEIGNTVIPALEHNFVNGTCSVCNSVEVIFPNNIPESGVYKKVTDVNEIISGGLFVIVAEADGTYYAMNQYGGGKVSSVPVSISGNYVTTETAPTWLIGTYGANGQIAIKTNENNYLAHTATAKTDMHDGRKTFGWIIEANDANNAFHIISSADDTRAIIFRTGENLDCFKAYALSNIGTTSYYADLQLYKLVEGEITECEHANTTVTTVAPSCIEAGSITETCDDCGETVSTETTEATGHSYTYTDNEDGTHAIGCENCDYSDSADHTFTDGECVCGAKDEITQKEKKFVKVTATSDITDGGKYLIVYEDGNLAFDGELTIDKELNTVAITINGSAIAYSAELERATFTISSGTIKGACGQYIGNNSNSNSLTYSPSALTNTISIDASGNLVVISNGGAYLRFNAASNQMRFRYYKSSSYTSQKAICLYKLVEE